MLLDVIYSICFNICLLVVLAFMMTKMDFVQRLLLNEEGGSEEGRGESVWQRLWEKVLLGVIFGVFCIISDYIGIQVTGALPNARVIGVLSAGFLGGPVSGFITTVIAAAHRYLIFPERISTVACVLSAIIHGIIGSFIGWKKKENRQYSNTFLLGVTVISEMIHIVLILLLTRLKGRIQGLPRHENRRAVYPVSGFCGEGPEDGGKDHRHYYGRVPLSGRGTDR